jgi:rubrerythrin
LNKELREAIPDEKNDSEKYLNMAVEAEDAGQHEDAKKLLGISIQEAIHGQIDEQILEHSDAANGEKWIQTATKPENKGKLTEYIRERYGKKGFIKGKGTIKLEVLRELANQNENPKVREEAQFALNVRPKD